MQRFSGLLLVVAGLAMGSYAYLQPPPDETTDVEKVTPVPAAPDRQVRRDDEPIRTFSPTSPAFRERASLDVADAAPSAAATKPSTWSTVVTAEQTESVALKSSAANDKETRFELARDLQRELRRVGCYKGEITGAWTPAAQAAMAAFMDRVNATLPTDEPDYILLTLVQGHGGIACGVECPSGQVSAEGGRCVPRAVVAQASRKSKRLEERRIAEARLGIHEAPSRAASANSDSQAKAPPSQTVATAEPEKLPWLDGNGQSISTSAIITRPEPLPGRMAVGGPVADVPLPSNSVASAPSDWQLMPGDSRDHHSEDLAKLNVGSTPSTVAALAPGENSGADASTSETSAEQHAVPLSAEAMPGNPQTSSGDLKSSNAAHRSDSERRPRYASTGRTRRGDPRPGTMHYNVAQALGGIY
jgi:hypothetical protein